MELHLDTMEARARRAYEWARVRRALLGALPLVAIVGVALLVGTRPVMTASLGAALFVGAAGLLWFGHGLPRAVLMGVATGLLPMGLVLCGARVGHACSGPVCMQLCFASSTLGGAAAGLLIGDWAFSRRVSAGLLLTATVFGLTTGALASTCVGFAGVAALAAGLAGGVGLQWARRAVRS